MRKFFGLMTVLAATSAARADAPALLPVQGVLADADGAPIEGDADMHFALYTTAVGGAPLWTETQTVLVEDGLFTAYLGTIETLDLALFRDHGTLFLGVAVGGDPEMDRFEIGSTGFAAFAQYAGTAARADDAATLGGHDASYFATAGGPVDWTALTGVPADLADGTDDDTLAGVSGCAGGQVLAWNGAGWGCADDADTDTTYTAGLGLTLTGTQFAADRGTVEGWAQGVCFDTEAELTALLDDNYRGAGWVPDWSDVTGIPTDFADGVDNDTTYTWGTLPDVPPDLRDGDNDTTYTAGTGLSLFGNAFSVNFGGTGAAATAARSDHTQPWSTLTSVPTGFADGIDNDTTYSAGAGLTLTGTTFAVSGVTSAMIADGTITSADIADSAITGADIANGTIVGADIGTDTITGANIGGGAVGTSEIANGSVIASHLSDGTALAEIADDDGVGSGLDADMVDGLHATSLRTGIAFTSGSWTADTSQALRISATITAPANGYVLVLAQGEKFANNAGETWYGILYWDGGVYNNDWDYSPAVGWSLWSLQNVFPVTAGTTYTFGVTDYMAGGDGSMNVYCSSLAAIFLPARL